MKILIASPEPEASDYGNGVTARRWASLLTELGHRIRIAKDFDGDRYDALVALHAKKSADCVRAFHARLPGAPVVIALTGTDLYPGLAASGVDPAVLERAARIVTLQERGVLQLPPELRSRARVITQSQPAVAARAPRDDRFEVAFLAHARPVKDPLLPAAAARLLPDSSRILISHAGAARESDMLRSITTESAANARYDWLGPLPRDAALDLLARSRLLLLTSRHEGGANVVTEALALGVPVLSTDIPGSVGLLGEDYPGYFPVGDRQRLAEALDASEHNRGGFYDLLRERCAALRFLASPDREKRAWADLLASLTEPSRPVAV